jgi:hypothetical protein
MEGVAFDKRVKPLVEKREKLSVDCIDIPRPKALKEDHCISCGELIAVGET